MDFSFAHMLHLNRNVSVNLSLLYGRNFRGDNISTIYQLWFQH